MTRTSLFILLLTLASPIACRADLTDELPDMVGLSSKQLIKKHGPTLRDVAKDGNEEHFTPTPWHVWKINAAKDELRYVIFYGEPLWSIPGTSSAFIVLLSAKGERIGTWRFSTGWRIDIKSASTTFDDKLDAQRITISTAPVIGGRDVAKQHFALASDKLYFIGMEDSKGKLIRNVYLYPNHTLGGELPARDLTGWTALLNSPRLPLRLAALTYLSGIHMNLDRPTPAGNSETEKEAALAQTFRTAESTKKQIAIYLRSDNTWLKEAADLAAAPVDEGH